MRLLNSSKKGGFMDNGGGYVALGDAPKTIDGVNVVLFSVSATEGLPLVPISCASYYTCIMIDNHLAGKIVIMETEKIDNVKSSII